MQILKPPVAGFRRHVHAVVVLRVLHFGNMDDYYCCYIDITVNLKICKLCLAPGYDFDYKMVSHKDAGNICEYCGRVPFTPVITLPLT